MSSALLTSTSELAVRPANGIAVVAPPAVVPESQHLVLGGVGWDAYEQILVALGDRPALRLNYDRGVLELMTTSARHGKATYQLGHLLVALADECGVEIEPGGSPTFRSPLVERGLEPDQCFWVANERRMRGRVSWDSATDPPPDLVLEVEISRSLVDRIPILAGLGVPEVWRYRDGSITVLTLGPDGSYSLREQSPSLPMFPVQELGPHVEMARESGFLGFLREFRAWVRERRTGLGTPNT